MKNVSHALHDYPEVKIYGERDRMYLLLNGADSRVVMDRLQPIFGIQTYSPVVKVERDIEALKAAAIEMIRMCIKKVKPSRLQQGAQTINLN